MVRVFQTTFKSAFYCVAAPVLTSQVYREAELLNTSDEDLLAGPITVYLEGRFMGRAEIMTVARGQTFVVGFGADPQLRARRELADRAENLQGGNRELAFKYRLVVENFKGEAVPVRVFDRLPYSDRPNDVRVQLGDPKDPLSTDKVYLRTERPKGLLRWDITVDGNATADKARIVDYGFTVDFDRNLAIQVQRGGALSAAVNAENRPVNGSGGMGMGGGGFAGRAFGGANQAPVQQADQPAPAASPEVQRQMQEFRSLQMEALEREVGAGLLSRREWAKLRRVDNDINANEDRPRWACPSGARD